jgi:hypothetical protein
MLMMDFTVESPPELIPRLQLLSERYARAVAGSPASAPVAAPAPLAEP